MSSNHARLHAGRWAAVRRFVFERDCYRCTSCGRAGRLDCDHVSPLQKEPNQDPYDPNGLQTLCRGCHIEKTRRENERDDPARDAWRALVQEILLKGEG